MRVTVDIQARQRVELDLDDENVEHFGLDAVVEEMASQAFDPDAADWEYEVEETVDA